jgi:hypothetical protein
MTEKFRNISQYLAFLCAVSPPYSWIKYHGILQPPPKFRLACFRYKFSVGGAFTPAENTAGAAELENFV